MNSANGGGGGGTGGASATKPGHQGLPGPYSPPVGMGGCPLSLARRWEASLGGELVNIKQSEFVEEEILGNGDLGAGSFGKVFLAHYHGEPVAVKVRSTATPPTRSWSL